MGFEVVGPRSLAAASIRYVEEVKEDTVAERLRLELSTSEDVFGGRVRI